ncbi:Uncharacterised protein [Bacteroides thetaiotaomicron]|uniref:Uncharacterized protein n=2 Tax=cellular organisms TaxID=131567 RepID=A0A174V2S4_BACT4|nr:Uncharacterised protein [Bacteroides thetaiotaomicron]
MGQKGQSYYGQRGEFCLAKRVKVEWLFQLENGEPMHEVFSSLAAAEMYSCAIRGKENIEWVEVSEEETIDLDELEDMFPDDFCGV